MTRSTIETAIREGIPFVIKMADGEKYEIKDPLEIALGKTFVMIISKDTNAHILPMLTMTGISYLEKNPKK